MDYKKKILNFWFPNDKYQDFWFDGSKDTEIINEFSTILEMAENNKFTSWEEDFDGVLALIILFDQMTRNIYRHDKILRIKNDTMALKLSFQILESSKDLEYPPYQRIFFLLPLRHQKKTHLLDYVMKKLTSYPEEDIILNKFMYATLKNYTDLTDTIEDYENTEEEKFHDNNQDILDNNCTNYRDKIWENKQILNLDFNNFNCSLVQNIESFYKKENIAVSLSGGVDSMVLLFISKILEINKKINKIYAIHIEYNNREESSHESTFLKNWCKLLNIPLITRKVYYMKRENIDRSFYEEETKKIRFNLYKYAIEKYHISGICLGHHYGDLGENVLMNIFNGRDLLDLFVMSDKSIIDKVPLYRPMLKNHKIDIYNFAHKYYIPYMKDTTPDWSCRGVIRKKILPVLVDQYDTGIYKNLAKLGNQSSQWNETMNNFILKPILNSIKYEEKTCLLKMTKEIINLPHIIWNKILIHIFHNHSIRMITQKSLIPFVEWLLRNSISKDRKKHIFSNKTSCLLETRENIDYLVFYL